jgi:ATP-dependent DNA helicase RecG
MTTGLQGAKRQEIYLYPEDAIREAVVNAVAHRDYRIAGLKNECRIYPDRLEVISAGGLPNVITLENIDKRHYSRNPKIMQAMLILGLTEELGQGISMMKHMLKANGNPPPEFIANPDQFKVIFYRPKASVSKGDIKNLLDGYFEGNTTISRRQIETICGVGSTSAKYLIEELLKNGYLLKTGKGPATRYKKQ